MGDAGSSHMSDIDVKGEGDRLMLVCQALQSIDLPALIGHLQYADAIGPFLDPTAYRDMLYRKGNMHDLLDVARAAQPLQKLWREKMENLGVEVA